MQRQDEIHAVAEEGVLCLYQVPAAIQSCTMAPGYGMPLLHDVASCKLLHPLSFAAPLASPAHLPAAEALQTSARVVLLAQHLEWGGPTTGE